MGYWPYEPDSMRNEDLKNKLEQFFITLRINCKEKQVSQIGGNRHVSLTPFHSVH